MANMRQHADCFTFTAHDYDAATGQATLSYDIDGRSLQETIVFPYAPWPVDASRQAAFLQALEVLHLIAGVSYYKSCLALRIDPHGCRLDGRLAGFLNELYLHGLAEFAYVNGLDLSGLIKFEANCDVAPPPLEIDLPQRALVAAGGGKDSLVSLQMLRDAGVDVQPACVGGSALIGDTVKAAGLPLLRIQRALSPELAKLNAAGAWNGHVPVTAINSAILLCAGLLYGHGYVVFSNESSANESTLQDAQGREVNHQYSKSIHFEKGFRSVVRQRVSSGIEYFSLLRPFSEIAISRRFSEMDRFHRVFSSCNRNFHLDGSHIEGRWCRDCPKCRFAALALAPFMTPRQLTDIQGADLLDEPSQLQGFKALCGLEADKPFECVGSVAESRSAIKALVDNPLWRGKAVVMALADNPAIIGSAPLELSPDFESEHFIPEAVMARLDAL